MSSAPLHVSVPLLSLHCNALPLRYLALFYHTVPLPSTTHLYIAIATPYHALPRLTQPNLDGSLLCYAFA